MAGLKDLSGTQQAEKALRPFPLTLQKGGKKNITLNGKAVVQSFCLKNSLYSEYSAL